MDIFKAIVIYIILMIMCENEGGLPLREESPPGSHQCPEDREYSGSPQDKQPSQSLWVVGLHHLDDPQQRLDSRSPQVTHIQPLQVYQARPTATEEEERGLMRG